MCDDDSVMWPSTLPPCSVSISWAQALQIAMAQQMDETWKQAAIDSKPYATFVFNHEGEQYVMRKDYERLRKTVSWISVAERLPAPGDKVLAFDPAMPIIQTGRADADGKWNCEGLTFLAPTHWMPLPAPPTDGK